MNKPLRDEFQDQEVALNPSDFLLSAFLEDFLNEDGPPDLKPRILARLEKIATGKEVPIQFKYADALCTCDEYDEAVQAASKEIANGYGKHVPPAPVELAGAVDGDFGIWIRRGILLVAALAAALLAAMFLPDALKPRHDVHNQVEIANKGAVPNNPITKNPSSSVASEVPDKSSNSPKDSLAVTPLENGSRPSDDPASVARETIASQANLAVKQDTPLITKNNSASGDASKVIGNEEVIGVINSQLSYLWNRVGLTAAPKVQIDVWLDRAAIAILGRVATAAEKESFRSSKSDSRVANYVDNLVSSDDFARFWSVKLAEHYLGKRLPTLRSPPKAESAFVEWLKASLVQKVFIGDIERQMIDGPKGGLDDQNLRTDPAAYWLTETMERAAINQRESIELVPPAKRRNQREESLIGVSRQLMRLSANPSMVCSQCHIDDTSSSDLHGYISMSKEQENTGSNKFWSVPSNLSGLTLLNQSAERRLKSEPQRDYFYEDAEGRMKLANAAPPSLRKDKSGLSLGEWFSSSSEPRRAIVEMVWGQLFKQPLVPVVGLSDEEGLNERVDLRELLASQIQFQKAELGSLVRWIVSSEIFRLEGQKTDAPWYLKSTESQIAESQRRMRMFAGFPAPNSIVAESGKLPPGKIASWIDQKGSFQKSGAATLAQGANVKSQDKPRNTFKLDYSEDQVRYLISIEEPYSKLVALAKRWGNSSMSWQMLLEHAYLATDARFPSRAEQDEALKLFEASGKDRTRSVVMIVNARLGSW